MGRKYFSLFNKSFSSTLGRGLRHDGTRLVKSVVRPLLVEEV